MPIINVAGTIIDFPDSGESPNWAQAMIDFAQAVSQNINGLSGAGDILPNFFTLDSLNPDASVNIPGFSFDTSIVRSTEISYSLIRNRDSTTLTEQGTIHAVYNPDASPGLKWEISRDYTGEGQISFAIDDTGQVNISTTAISGVGVHTGTLGYSAKSILNS